MVPKVGRGVAHARTSRSCRPRVMVRVVNVLFLQFVVWTLAGWMQRGQQSTIAYLVEENRVLREQLGRRRVRLTDDQRRRLAVRAKALGRAALGDVAGIVTPNTLLRWYRNLVARKYDGSRARATGRPRTAADRRCEVRADSGAESELQPARRAFRENGQNRMFGSLRHFRRASPAALGHGVHRTLPDGALSPRDRQPNHQADAIPEQRQREARCDRAPVASRWTPQLLLPRDYYCREAA
jgi:hypothetical protein